MTDDNHRIMVNKEEVRKKAASSREFSWSKLDGFYNPIPSDVHVRPTLYVCYRFKGKLHEVTVADHEALWIPVRKHCLRFDEAPQGPDPLVTSASSSIPLGSDAPLTVAWRGWFLDLISDGPGKPDAFSLFEPPSCRPPDGGSSARAMMTFSLFTLVAFCIAANRKIIDLDLNTLVSKVEQLKHMIRNVRLPTDLPNAIPSSEEVLALFAKLNGRLHH
jgi:hypothetical protein